jgi:septal ring factor EnvC (AmiA/AmiB activator)
MEQQDPNTFTQKDLMQHLLNASQHVATREELLDVKSDMDRRFELVDKRFEQVGKRFEQVDKRFDELRSDIKEQGNELRSDIKEQGNELRSDIKEQGKRHDRLSWYIFAGMLAIFFKEHLVKLLT